MTMERHMRADGRLRGAGTDDIITATVDEFCHLAGLGRSKVYEMLGDGKIESVLLGGRRLIVVDSWRRLVAAAPRDLGPRPAPTRPAAG
jgi:excisionase family DNA binding protein